MFFPREVPRSNIHICHMNRREFHKLVGSAALMAGLPVGGKTAVAGTLDKGRYAWAAAIARVQNRMSPQLLVDCLHMEPEAARMVCAELVKNGVVTTPNAVGLSRAVSPLYATGRTIPVAAANANSAQQATGRLSKIVKKQVMETGETETIPPETDAILPDDDSAQPKALDAAHSAE